MAHKLKFGASSAAEKPAATARIISADFIASHLTLEALPRDGLPEIAFVGRSNVGKSSLFNALCRRRKLARVSKTPGRTQSMNFFQVKLLDSEDATKLDAYFVDLPGFGYAAIGKETREWWGSTLADYILYRKELRRILLLVDSRREPGPEEKWFVDSPQGKIVSIVLTKCDQLSRNELSQRRKAIAESFELEEKRLFLVSTEKREYLDRSGLEQEIVAACRGK